MKYLSAIFIAIFLSGCSVYDSDEIDESKAACDRKGGLFSTASGVTSTMVENTYCTFGGFKYTYDRSSKKFISARRP